MNLLQCNNLTQAEEYLQTLYQDISIISEVPVAKSELVNLESIIKRVFRTNQARQELIHSLWRQYPLCCLTVTVYIGIYYYDGNFWGHFTSRTGCSDDQTWKECLLTEIKKRKLPVFDEFGSQKYVSTILGHAGVPQKSFSGFMAGFIEPIHALGISAAEAMSYVTDENEETGLRMQMLHKGVRDYLSTGGKVAEDFVDRCLQLVHADLTDLDVYQRYLPRRILKLFQEWQKSQSPSKLLKTTERLVMPEVKLDSFREGLDLFLPTQIWKDPNIQQVVWKIHCNDALLMVIPCDVVILRSSGHFQFIAQQPKLQLKPYQTYDVRFELNGTIQRKWRFSTKPPLLFDPKQQNLLRRQDVVQMGQLIVLDHGFEAIRSSATVDMSKERMYGDWRQFNVWEVSAEVRSTLRFSNGSETIDMLISAEVEKPFLRTVDPVRIWGMELPACYDWPVLCLPVSSYPDIRTLTTHWMLQLGHARTGEKTELSLGDLRPHIHLVGLHYEIPLHLLNMPKQIGQYQLRLLAGLGSDIILNFTILPASLRIHPLESPSFPQSFGTYNVQTFRVEIENQYSVNCLGPSTVNFITLPSNSSTRVYQLQVPVEVTHIQCELLDTGTGESMSIELITKALAWEISVPDGSVIHNTCYQVDIQQFQDQLERCRVVMNTSMLKTIVDTTYIAIHFRLTDHIGNEVMTKTIRHRVGVQLRLEPRLFLETLQDVDVESCQLWVELEHLLARPFRLMEIQKAWVISNINVGVSDQGNLNVSWNESSNRSHRVLRVWHDCEPWKSYEKYEIPENNQSLQIPWSQKAQGLYILEWDVQQPTGLFDFLQETNYPLVMERCYPFDHVQGYPSDNPLSAAVLYEKWHHEYIEFTWQHIYELMTGIQSYGEGYWVKLKKKAPIFREFFKAHRNILVDQLAVKEAAPIAPFVLDWIGIEEWPREHITQLDAAAALWGEVDQLDDSPNAFGTTRQFISILEDKTVEDLHQIRQSIPASEGFLQEYNVPVYILSFVIQCKADLKYRLDVNRTMQTFQPLLNHLWELWKRDSVHYRLSQLLTCRREILEEPLYLNYPWLVAMVAAGLRLHARGLLRNEFLPTIRAAQFQIEEKTKEWLQHDLYMMEALLQHS